MDAPVAIRSRRSASTRTTDSSSNGPVGSSRSKTGGSGSTALISEKRCFSPVESCAIGASRRSTRSPRRAARAATSLRLFTAKCSITLSVHHPDSADTYVTCFRHAGADIEARSLSFSQTSPSLGSRSAIMRRKRLLPDPDEPVIAAHIPMPRFNSNGPANWLRSFFTSSAASIEFPCLFSGPTCVAKIAAPTIKTIPLSNS